MTDPDHVDRMMAQWQRERPDLNLDAMEIFGRLGRMVAYLGHAIDQTFASAGLQRGEYDVLAALRRAGAPYTLSPSALSETLLLSRAGMTNRLDRLESAGLIKRRNNREDRRGMHIDLTAAGLEMVDEVTTRHVANETELLSVLSAAERRNLNAIARKLLAGYESQE